MTAMKSARACWPACRKSQDSSLMIYERKTASDSVQGRAASAVRVLVAFGKRKQDDFLALVVEVVKQSVGANAKPILGGEL